MKKILLTFVFALGFLFSLFYFRLEQVGEVTDVFSLEVASDLERRFFLDFRSASFDIDRLPMLESEFQIQIQSVFLQANISIQEEKINREFQNIYYVNPDDLRKKYQTILLKYGLYDDLERLEVYPVQVKFLCVYGRPSHIKRLQEKYPSITLMERDYELFESIEK